MYKSEDKEVFKYIYVTYVYKTLCFFVLILLVFLFICTSWYILAKGKQKITSGKKGPLKWQHLLNRKF